MTEVWDSRYSKVVQWNGDPQDAPDNCETCDGAGRIYDMPFDKITLCNDRLAGLTKRDIVELVGGTGIAGMVARAVLSTNDLPDDIECPECRGYGMVY